MNPSAKKTKVLNTDPEIKEQKTQSFLNKKSIKNIPEINSKLFENSLDAMMIGSQDGRIYAANPAACNMLGWSEKEICRLGRNGIVVHNKQLTEAVRNRRKSGSFFGELTYMRKDGTNFPVEVSSTVFSHSDGREFTTIIIRDISERKKTEQALNESKLALKQVSDWYLNIIEGSLDAIFISDDESRLIAVNKATCDLTGYSKKQLLKMKIPDLHDEPDLEAYIKYHKRIFRGEKILSEAKILRSDGTKVDTEFNNSRISISGRYYMHTTARDVTFRKMSEIALKESENKFRTLFESMRQGVFYQSLDGRHTDINQAAMNMFGITRDEFLGRTSHNTEWKVIDENGSVLKPEDYPSMSALQTGQAVKDMTVGFFNPVRNNFTWVVTNAIPEYRNGEINPFQVFVTMHDITDKKNMEDALAKRESELRIIHENIMDIVWRLDKDTRITYISPSVKKLLGYEAEYFNGKPILDFIAKEYHNSAKQNIQSRLVTGKSEVPVLFQYEMVAKDGSKIPIEVSSNPIWDKEGTLLGFTGVTRNITERKRAEKALYNSELKFRLLTESLIIGIYIIQDEKLVYVNPSFAKTLGYLPEEIAGKLSPQDIIHPDDIQTAMKKLQERLEGIVEIKTIIFKAIKKDGTPILTEVFGISMDFQGRQAVMGSMIDVTERINSELKLRNSEEEYRSIFENSLMGISQSYPQGGYRMVNKAYAEMYGYPDIETMLTEVSDNIKKLYSNSDSRQSVLRILEKEGFMPPTEFELKKRNGDKFWAMVSARQVKDNTGKLLYLQAEHIDITHRKILEKEMYSASLYARSLIEASLDPLVTINSDGKITDVNSATEKITGLKRSKLIGSEFLDYFTEPDKARAGYKAVFSKGEVKDYPLTLRHIDGRTTDVLYHATLFKNEAGEVQGVFAAARDITERKKMEEELRKSHELLEKLNQHLVEAIENERNQIALNLHDDLGQKLTAINLDIAWLKRRIGIQSKTVREKFNEMSTMIVQTIESIRETSSLLRPAILFDLGLVPAIKTQLGRFEKQTGIPCHFHYAPEEFKLEDSIALILYRILQESLTNIARHSGASATETELYNRNNKIEMTIADNGNGIAKEKVNSLGSMGIAGMKERVKSANGKIIIRGEPGKGTRIKVIIPLMKEKVND